MGSGSPAPVWPRISRTSGSTLSEPSGPYDPSAIAPACHLIRDNNNLDRVAEASVATNELVNTFLAEPRSALRTARIQTALQTGSGMHQLTALYWVHTQRENRWD
jgi:hypothetical protein